ncbi:hypothetical protein RR48_01247 [Papilio machaon]|uniref:Uncharacterized protein n=1 Tax=Papilio machaon TaxID=76193 RepID=A0A0N0PBC9_PAPMA|nr:hypothetical protein RR48_01247 [Papilio machaon]
MVFLITPYSVTAPITFGSVGDPSSVYSQTGHKINTQKMDPPTGLTLVGAVTGWPKQLNKMDNISKYMTPMDELDIALLSLDNVWMKTAQPIRGRNDFNFDDNYSSEESDVSDTNDYSVTALIDITDALTIFKKGEDSQKEDISYSSVPLTVNCNSPYRNWEEERTKIIR